MSNFEGVEAMALVDHAEVSRCDMPYPSSFYVLAPIVSVKVVSKCARATQSASFPTQVQTFGRVPPARMTMNPKTVHLKTAKVYQARAMY